MHILNCGVAIDKDDYIIDGWEEKMHSNSRKRYWHESLNMWEEKLMQIFNGSIPEHYEWNDILQINNMIKNFCEGRLGRSYMFYPNDNPVGKKDILGCNISPVRNNLLGIRTSFIKTWGWELKQWIFVNLCKPKQLTFDCIDGDIQWSYFRLELDELEPSGVYYLKEDEVVESLYASNGVYIPYNDIPPNDFCRHIVRILKGTLLIVPARYDSFYDHFFDSLGSDMPLEFYEKVRLQSYSKYDYVKFRSKMEEIRMEAIKHAQFLKEEKKKREEEQLKREAKQIIDELSKMYAK